MRFCLKPLNNETKGQPKSTKNGFNLVCYESASVTEMPFWSQVSLVIAVISQILNQLPVNCRGWSSCSDQEKARLRKRDGTCCAASPAELPSATEDPNILKLPDSLTPTFWLPINLLQYHNRHSSPKQLKKPSWKRHAGSPRQHKDEHFVEWSCLENGGDPECWSSKSLCSLIQRATVDCMKASSGDSSRGVFMGWTRLPTNEP